MESKNRIGNFVKNDLWIVLLDILAINAAYVLALYARFIGYDTLNDLFRSYLSVVSRFAPFYTAVCVTVFAYFHLYNGMWKYAGLHDFDRVLFASAITSILYFILTLIFFREMPLTFYALGAV